MFPQYAGSRESALALTQTQLVIAALTSQYPDWPITLKTFKTLGDKFLDQPLTELGGKGLFVKELEQALLQGDIDFAIHSMKDMPANVPEGLILFPFGKREVPTDALVGRQANMTLNTLPQGARIGTASLRRQAVLKRLRPDLQIEMVRGNVQTRLRKLDNGQFDALILAAAGLNRLGLSDRITQLLSPEEMLPAACQGTLAVEIANPAFQLVFEPWIDAETAICTAAERAFLQTLQGGCQIPMAAYAQKQTKGYFIQALLFHPETLACLKAEQAFEADQAHQAGVNVATSILNQGGGDILDQLAH